MHLFVLILLLNSCLSCSDKIPQCTKPNEVWGCISPCDPTCSNPNPNSITCKVACRPGCACIDGYLRNSREECIPIQKCNECNAFELQEYASCGSDCPSCGNSCASCATICYTGCFCISGYLQNSWGQCIARETCQSCGNNEEFREGVSGCPPSCKEPNPPVCPTLARQDECSCVEGYVKGPNNKCVRLEDCPLCS